MTVEPGGPATPMSERMQSLLSRAVEDQLSEQRQLAGALTDVRNQLARLTQEVESARSSSGGSGADAALDARLGAVSGEVREAVRLLGERVDAVGRLVQQRGADLAEIRAAVAELEATTRSHTDALGGISHGLAALPAYGDRIAALQDNLTGLHERVSAVDTIGSAVTTLQQHIDEMDKDLRELRSAFAGIGSRMAELPGRGDVEAAVTRGLEPLADVAARMARLESQLVALGLRLEQPGQPDQPVDDERDTWLREELARFAESVTQRGETMLERMSDLEASVQSLATQLDEALTAEDETAEEEAPEEAVGDDPVLAEIADLREVLVGTGGLAERVEALADDDVEARVSTAVSDAVSAAEERLAAHIDQAVLALAEALLRKRGRGAPSPSRAPAAAPEPQLETEPETPPDRDDEGEQDASADAGVDAPAHDDAPTWQTPPVATNEDSGEDSGRRRRPWWRPGD